MSNAGARPAPHAPSLAITLRPSLALAAALAVLHGLALVAIAWSGLPGTVRVALAAGAGLSLAQAIMGHVWRRGGTAIVALRFAASGEVRALTRDGTELACRVRADSLVHPVIVVLRLEGGRGARTVLVDAGSVGREDFRRLRVMLRWGRGRPPAAGAGTTPA